MGVGIQIGDAGCAGILPLGSSGVLPTTPTVQEQAMGQGSFKSVGSRAGAPLVPRPTRPVQLQVGRTACASQVIAEAERLAMHGRMAYPARSPDDCGESYSHAASAA